MAVVLNQIGSLRNEFFRDEWVWDSDSKSPDVVLSQNSQAAYFHVNNLLESNGTAGVRGSKAFIDGEHYWEISFLEPPSGTSVEIGVGTREARLQTTDNEYVNLLGQDDQSWGLSYKGYVWHNGQCRKYCEPFYSTDAVIGVHLDLYKGTLSFYLNGKCLGVAFNNVNCQGNLYPVISSTAVETEIEVGLRTCRYLSLQDKCCLTVLRSLQHSKDINILPLPGLIKEHIMELK